MHRPVLNILYVGNGPQRANTAFQRNSQHNMDQLPCVLGAMPLKKMRPVHLCLIAIFFKWPLATKGRWKSCLLVRADDQPCLMFITIFQHSHLLAQLDQDGERESRHPLSKDSTSMHVPRSLYDLLLGKMISYHHHSMHTSKENRDRPQNMTNGQLFC